MNSFGKRQKHSFLMHIQHKEASRKNSKFNIPLKQEYNDPDTSMSQSSPKGAASLNAQEIADQLEQVIKSYHFSHKPSKYMNSSAELENRHSPQNSMEFNDKILMSYDEGKEGIGSSSNLSGAKSLIERSNTLATRKKVKELSLIKVSKGNLSPNQEKSIPRGSMMLNRFIDGMILKGNLPLDANDLFSPALKSPTLKSPTIKSPILQSPRSAKNIMTQVRLKPIPKKEINGSPTMRDIDNFGISQNIDIIPNWMANLSDFNEKYNTIKMRAKFPIYEILNRDDEFKGDLELNIVCKWLEKMDLFQRFPYDKLLELSRRLKTVFLRDGQVLCNVGDNADCLYIIYEGEIEVLIPEGDSERTILKAQSGEVLGRHTLETPGKRTAKLRATKPTYVVSLYRNDYQEVTGEIRNMIRPAHLIQTFVSEHSFLKQFSQVQLLSCMNHFEFRKHYKNDIIYNIGDASEKFYFLMEGEVTRELPITKESINKWPKGLKTWEMYKKAVTYSVKLPLETGEIFGLKEFLENKPREEKLITEGDALILSCPKKFFYDMFEQYEISIFEKKAEQDEKVKAEKLCSVFEISTKILKIKEDAMENIVNKKIKVGKNESQEIKVKEWKRAFSKFTTAAKTEKKVVDKKETHKTLTSIYDS